MCWQCQQEQQRRDAQLAMMMVMLLGMAHEIRGEVIEVKV